MPALHPYSGGADGIPHENTFVIADPEAAYVMSAKLLALDAIDLLWEDGGAACALAAEKPLLTRDAYRHRFDWPYGFCRRAWSVRPGCRHPSRRDACTTFWSAAACRRFGKREQAPALHKPLLIPTRAKPATQFNLTQRHKGHKVFF